MQMHARALGTVAFALAAASCGSGGQAPMLVSVAVSPQQASVRPLEGVVFTATVTGASTSAVTAQLSGLYPSCHMPIGLSPDPNVTGTVIRKGNFDCATSQVHWVNGPQQLPASLYLSSKPAFFGNNPWPRVDPTGTVKVATLPAGVRFDGMHT